MTKIKAIDYWKKGNKYYIKLTDGQKLSIRAATYQAMKLEVGQRITFEQLQEFEKFVWKKVYGPNSWENEKKRINLVIELVKNISSDINCHVVGFGADTTETLYFHPKESGSPDLMITDRFGNFISYIEVTGSEVMRGNDYWVRPDKLMYAQKHIEKNIWIVLHYELPDNKFVFIKPSNGINYEQKVVTKKIRNIDEKYVIFTDYSDEVKTYDQFKSSIKKN